MKERLVDALFVLALFAVAIFMALNVFATVQAAPPTVAPCQVVNTFGTIEIARCEPENGLPYYVNSVGFMLFEEW